MPSPSPISDTELNAYADRQLAPDRVAALESALARDPEMAARLAAIRAQNAAITQALDPWLGEPIPGRLLAAATPPASRGPALSLSWWRPAGALAATLAIGIAAGWFGREAMLERQGMPTTFPRQAAYAHVMYAGDRGRPVEISAQEEQRLERWLTRRLGIAVSPPDLSAVGFKLVGGRLVAGNEKPTGLFMYEDAEGRRLTLQWRKNEPGTREVAFRYAEESGVGIFYWVDGNCAYALLGDVDRPRLLAVARTVSEQLAAAYAQHLQR